MRCTRTVLARGALSATLACMTSSETWSRRVAEWRVSGKTADEFSAGRGFAGSTLRWWASRLGRERAAMVQVVRAAPSPLRDACLELAVGQVRVLVRAGFDRALLHEVLGVLGARRA